YYRPCGSSIWCVVLEIHQLRIHLLRVRNGNGAVVQRSWGYEHSDCDQPVLLLVVSDSAGIQPGDSVWVWRAGRVCCDHASRVVACSGFGDSVSKRKMEDSQGVRIAAKYHILRLEETSDGYYNRFYTECADTCRA